MTLFLIHGRAVTVTGVKSISFAMGCQIRLDFKNICGRKITGKRQKIAFWVKKNSTKVPTIEPQNETADLENGSVPVACIVANERNRL